MQKVTKVRGLPRNWIIEQYENNSDISEEMKEKIDGIPVVITWNQRKLEITLCAKS